MELDDIIYQLNTSDDIFPEEALQAAIDRREDVTPALLQLLEESIEKIDEIYANSSYMGHVYAMMLLAQFREYKAYPLIARFFSLPCDPMDTMGEGGYECIRRILASVCHGDDSLIKEMIENESVNDFSRGAAIEALTCLVVTEQASREDVLAYLGALLRRQPPESGEGAPFFYAKLISEMTDLYPEELYEDIVDAFDRDIVDTMFIDKEFVDSYLAQGKDAVLSLLKKNTGGYVDDGIGAMRPWFQLEREEWISESDEILEKIWSLHEGSQPKPVSGKIKTGRNEPCPCGSGKKYKKCCGA